MDAWGKNASFQLAALHAICRILPDAADILGKDIDPRWSDVDLNLPPYATVEGVFLKEWNLSNKRIALWEGMDLVESHRHHSHLGGIWPFVTIDPFDESHSQIVQNSFYFKGSRKITQPFCSKSLLTCFRILLTFHIR